MDPSTQEAKAAATPAQISNESLDRLAISLGRPPKALSAFANLTPEQVEFLSAAIAQTCERERRSLGATATAPAPLRWLVGQVIRMLRA